MKEKSLEELLRQIYYVAINGEIIYQRIPLGESDLEFIANRKEEKHCETLH